VRALARTIRLGLDPSPAPAALGDGNPSLVARRLAKLLDPRRTSVMIRHRVAIAAAAIIVAAGLFLPVAPAKLGGGSEPAIPELARLWNANRLVSVAFDDAPAAQVLEAIAAAGEIRLDMEGQKDCCRVSVSLTNVPVRQALEAVAARTEVRYKVDSADRLRVKLPSPLVPTDDMTMPQIVTKVEPMYPHDARDARIGGKVILQAVIRDDGTVGDVQILSIDGPSSLGDSAVAAVKQWTYRPAIKGGRKVSVYTTMKVDYRLR